MGPVITEVEEIDELFPLLETSQVEDSLVDNRLIDIPLRIEHSNAGAITELELMQVRPIPPRKGIINRSRQLTK